MKPFNSSPFEFSLEKIPTSKIFFCLSLRKIFSLGSLLSRRGNLIAAEKYTQEAIKFNSKFELAYVNLGTIKIDLDKLSEAEELFLSALEINENYNYAYANLFRLYEKTNNINKLKLKIEKLNNNLNINNEILMYKARVAFREKDFVNAKKLIDQVSAEWTNQTDQNTSLLFWSFKAFIEEKVKNFDEAFKCFEKSQLNLKYEDYNPVEFQNYIKTYRRNLDSKKYLGKNKTTSVTERQTAFLIGFPRSGTTLLDTILRSHPEIDVLEEKPIINSVEQIIKSKYKYSLDELDRLDEDELDFLRKHYLETLKNNSDRDKNAKILIDKFPFQTVCLPLINLLFPDSKIIFTHRNPYDTVLSCFQQAFEPNNAMSNFRTIDSAAKIYNLTMNVWTDYQKNLNFNYITSKYEDLIEDFDSHISKILNFLYPGTIAIHLNYGDPCPNFIAEAISLGVPCIVNEVGGAKEIAMDASVSSENEIKINGYLMPKTVNVIRNLEKIMLNYEEFQNNAKIRADKISLKKYVKEHLSIFNKI